MKCFGWFSKLIVTEVEEDEQRQAMSEDAKHLRKYEEQIAHLGEPGYGEKSDDHYREKRKFDIFQRFICYDVRARILFGTLFAIFIGIGLPLIIYFADKPMERDEIYGSCFLKQEFRVKCLPNQLTEPTEGDCIAAKCCWNGNQSLPFNCFHSLTSSYHYFVSNLQRSSPSDSVALLEKVDMDLTPNLHDRMRSLKVHIEWQSAEHLNVHIFDPMKTKTGHNSVPLPQSNAVNKQKGQKRYTTRGGHLDTQQFLVNYATDDEYFFIKIQRNESEEVIFDTRLGPLIAGDDYISFTTALSSSFFYGLKGGLSGGPATYDNFNQFGPSDLPFYLAFEARSGRVHGVLLDTISPYLTQYMEAPALMFHLEGQNVALDLHFFVGPTVKDVYRQLRSYLRSKQDQDSPTAPTRMEMPPYWALGLHICRTAIDHVDALEQINATKSLRIPYDSDCIAENFRTPFQIDNVRYPSDATETIMNHLAERNLKILLNQKVILPGAGSEAGTDLANPLLRLIMWNQSHPFVGLIDSETTAYYPDYLASDSAYWLKTEFARMDSSELYGGLTIVDNYPLTYDLNGICDNEEGTRIKTRLLQNFAAVHSETKHGLICPDARHQDQLQHFDVHNLYGPESLLKIRAAYESSLDSSTMMNQSQRLVFTSSSIWTDTMDYGGFNGPEVPFTWEGMTESLGYILRNFMFLTYAGTPICGSYLPTNMDPSDTNELCFRWFQLGLLLPFARNSYSADGPKGILDLSTAYQDRVIKNIRERYKYNPYYYTLLYEYEVAMMGGEDDEDDDNFGGSEISTEVKAEPPIRPLVYDFPQASSNLTFRITTQFMIGPTLMAAPILTRSSQREAYFPPGIWYNLAGKLQWSNEAEGGLSQVDGFVIELPIYLRGGFIIPALEEPVPEGNAMKSREGNYLIIATFPTIAQPVSRGKLFIDDGFQKDSIETENYDLLEFDMSSSALTINVTCGLLSDVTTISRTINQIKIFGFPKEMLQNITIETSLEGNRAAPRVPEFLYDEENEVLHLQNLALKWCVEFDELVCKWEFEETDEDDSDTTFSHRPIIAHRTNKSENGKLAPERYKA